MDLVEAIKQRRSVRKFTRQVVKEEAVSLIIEAATYAPSAGNIQPWEFIIVRNPQTIRQLADAAYSQSQVEDASVAIVICANERLTSAAYGERGRTLYCLQDTAAATQNLLLSACSLGLGACWIGAFKENQVKQVLDIPKYVKPVAIVPLGYPDVIPRKRILRPLADLVHREQY